MNKVREAPPGMHDGARVPASSSPARARTWSRSFGYMAEALLLAVIFVYLILAAQFESFIDPLAIMLSLPLSIVGMAGMLLPDGGHDQHHVPHRPHHADGAGDEERHPARRLREGPAVAGHGARREALITAGRTRLRPIMMTTLAMIFGMLPLALALGAGAEMRAPWRAPSSAG